MGDFNEAFKAVVLRQIFAMVIISFKQNFDVYVVKYTRNFNLWIYNKNFCTEFF